MSILQNLSTDSIPALYAEQLKNLYGNGVGNKNSQHNFEE